jgi:glycosyltransferase involved in cell wall biosynthesis
MVSPAATVKVLVVTNMYPSPARPHWGAFVRSQTESLERLGVETQIFEIEGWRGAWRYARALVELPRVARASRAALVHAHYGLSGAAALRVRDLPLVVSFCGDDLLGRPDDRGRIEPGSRWLTALSRVAARHASAVIVKSEEMRRRLPDGVAADVIPNGVDLERFRPVDRDEARRRLGWTEAGAVMLFAGPPEEPRKNWPLARAVEERLRARGFDVRLVAVHGRPQDEVALAMSAADVLVLPSFHEGSPNVVKEALAANLPVVAAPVGDCEERLAGVTPGAVVARDEEAFAAAVEAVLRAGTRSNGREKVASLELSRVAQRVLGVYSDTVDRWRQHGPRGRS